MNSGPLTFMGRDKEKDVHGNLYRDFYGELRQMRRGKDDRGGFKSVGSREPDKFGRKYTYQRGGSWKVRYRSLPKGLNF